MKLEDLYKSELSDLNIEPRKGGYDRVKTALVNRMVRNTLILSTVFVLFFVGLGELAKYKKTKASQEIKFPKELFKVSEKQKESKLDESNLKYAIPQATNKNYFPQKNNTTSISIVENNFNNQEKEKNVSNLFLTKTYVEVPRESFYGIQHLIFQNQKNSLKSNFFYVLGEEDSKTYIDVKSKQNLAESVTEKIDEQKSDLAANNKEDNSFPAKKPRKIAYSTAIFYGFNNTLQQNSYQNMPCYLFQFGIKYPLYDKYLFTRIGFNLGSNHHLINHRSFGQDVKTDLYNYTLEIPFLVEIPLTLKHNFIISFGTGTRLINTISHSEKSNFEDGTTSNISLFEDSFKSTYFTFFTHFVLSKTVHNKKFNLIIDYQPTFAREVILTGRNSIYNEYGISNLQIGLGIDF